MFKSFIKKEIIILGLVVLCFLVINIEYSYRQKRNTNEILGKEFTGIVADVRYENRVNKITLESGASLGANLEMFDAVNSHYQNKKFEEFIFPGDSIFKSAKSGDLEVFPLKGDSFVIVIGYYLGGE